MFKSLLMVAPALVLATSVSAVEWQQSSYELQGAVSYHQLDTQLYRRMVGINLGAAYRVPVFVEGHTRAKLAANYRWSMLPQADTLGGRGGTLFALQLEALVQNDLTLASKKAWWGLGLYATPSYMVNHYQLVEDQATQQLYGEALDGLLLHSGMLLQFEWESSARFSWGVNTQIPLIMYMQADDQWSFFSGYWQTALQIGYSL